MPEPKADQQPDLRFLMPVSEDMFSEHRPGSLPPVEILRYARAAVAEIEQMLKLYQADSAVHRTFDELCNGWIEDRNGRAVRHSGFLDIVTGCINAYNEGLAVDTGNEELERAKDAASRMARMQAEATRQANSGGPRPTVNSQRPEGEGSQPSTADDDALANAEVKETMTTVSPQRKPGASKKRKPKKSRKKPNVRKRS